VIQILEQAGFDGWYVLEQDCSLTEEPPEGGGPVADAARSLEYLRSAAETAAP
jgi:inosose dehydratase